MKQLTARTAQAADTVAGQIAAVQDETTAAVAAIDAVNGTIAEIHTLQESAVTAVDDQSAQVARIVGSVDTAVRSSQEIAASTARLAEAQRSAYLRTALATALDVLARHGDVSLDTRSVTWSVTTKAGRRAVGTSIPPRTADGGPNRVLATVLAGDTYFGEAVVVDRLYHAAYAPLRGGDGQIIGMLYVGLPKD